MNGEGRIIGLMGNPNSGKSSLFNALCGLRQKVGNFPGVTVDKKVGKAVLGDEEVRFIDFPGSYSLFPNSQDERIVVEFITNTKHPEYPDLILYVVDATQLEKHLLLATQIRDLGLPMVVALNMYDLVEQRKDQIDIQKIASFLYAPVIPISTKTGYGISQLKDELLNTQALSSDHKNPNIPESDLYADIATVVNSGNSYLGKIIAHHCEWLSWLSQKDKRIIQENLQAAGFSDIKEQVNETMERYNHLTPLAQKAIIKPLNSTQSITEKIDQILTHRWLGPLLFFALNLLIFQAIYAWSEWPMTLIEEGIASIGEGVRGTLSSGWFSDLLVDGVIAGIGGILVFVPQILILFTILSVLEEVGYMSRAVYLFDGIMRKFGLNGRSVVALISSAACAIPAIMSTRTISDPKERLITILVSPLISCSARIPVYVILIGLIIPKDSSWGIFNTQGLVFMGMYLLGISFALISAYVFKKVLKSTDQSLLMIELPKYKPPIARNVLITVKEKVFSFITEAGKVIMVISIVLWFLASYGPGDSMKEAEDAATVTATEQNMSEGDKEDLIASQKIEASYAGHLGKWIEPAIRPLGYDWKIGIALLTSFAAREVFVGTMATIYSIGSSEDETTIREKMRSEINPDTGEKRFDFATGLSLLIFYVFAMQCMSTLAITKKETNSWKWPLLQFVYMSFLAYFGALMVYQFLN